MKRHRGSADKGPRERAKRLRRSQGQGRPPGERPRRQRERGASVVVMVRLKWLGRPKAWTPGITQKGRLRLRNGESVEAGRFLYQFDASRSIRAGDQYNVVCIDVYTKPNRVNKKRLHMGTFIIDFKKNTMNGTTEGV